MVMGVGGLGEAVSGWLMARSVEPEAGEASGIGHPENCLNCGAALVGEYCHACGQKGHVNRTLASFWHDLLHGLFNFEGKIWRTLPMLAWRPGDLTRRYIDGQRARFVSPIALFLFTVFLMFAVASATGGLSDTNLATPEMRKELAQDAAKQEAAVAELRKERDVALRAGRSTRALDAKIADNVQEIAVLKGLRSGEVRTNPKFQVSDNNPAWLRQLIKRAGDNPDLLLFKIKTNAYKYSWALIPLSVPFLWLLFPFSRRFRLYDHTAFVTYSLSFMTLLVVVAMLLGAAGLSATAGLLIFFIPPVHMYRQLKGTYGLSRTSALLRTMLLLVFTFIALVLFGLVLVALGLFD
jgi:hypothetical protein